MQTTIRTLLVSTLFSACMLAQAQTAGDKMMSITIPFGFEAEGHLLPAGHYTVSKSELAHILNLRDSSGRHGTFLFTIPDQGRSLRKSAMVFLHTGQQYRLRQVQYGTYGESFNVNQVKAQVVTSQSMGQIRTIIADPE